MSIKNYQIVVPDEFIMINWKFSQSMDILLSGSPNVDEFFGEIYLPTESGEVDTIIGEVVLHLYKQMDDYSIYDAFDRTLDTSRFLCLFDEHNEFKEDLSIKLGWEQCNCYGNVLVIDRIVIKSKYRNNGFGKKVIAGIEKLFYPLCTLIIIESFPLQHSPSNTIKDLSDKYNFGLLNKNLQSSKRLLNKFYKDCGYSLIPKTGNMFIKNTSYVSNIDVCYKNGDKV